MNIYNSPSIQRLARIFQTDNETTAKVRSSRGPAGAPPSDRVDLSSEGMVLHAIQQRLAETPDVRWEKVQALKEAIARGEYRITADKIAAAMLREGKLP